MPLETYLGHQKLWIVFQVELQVREKAAAAGGVVASLLDRALALAHWWQERAIAASNVITRLVLLSQLAICIVLSLFYHLYIVE